MKRQQIQANGLNFSYLEAGSGPLVLCLHGYPDTADTWTDLIPKLATAGFRAIAPNMRGYSPTEIPGNGYYGADALAKDVIGLLDAFEVESAHLVGHDWGALTAYGATSLAPERVNKLVTVAIPHPRALKFDLAALWKARHFITYQFKGIATWQLKRNNYAHVDMIYRRWSPNWAPSAEDLAPVKEAFSSPGGVEAALGYYWSFRANARNSELQRTINKRIAVPTLTWVGEADGALDMSAMTRTADAFTAFYEYIIVPQAGHFLHREIPEEFATKTIAFLQAN